jgi:hypothetical protein
VRERALQGFKKLPTGDEYYEVDTNILHKRLEDESEMGQFWEWLHNKDKESWQVPDKPRVTTAQDFINAFSSTDYMDYDSLGDLCDLLQHPVHPYIPVGSHNGYEYRLSPSLDFLDAPLDRIDEYDNRPRTSESIVGINLVGKRIHITDSTRQQQVQQNIDASDESHITDSDSRNWHGNDSTGFVCFQAGILEAARPDRDKQPKDWDWDATDWVMVVVIDEHNHAGNVWLLQNFNIYIPDAGDFYRIPVTDTQDWGFFLGDENITPRPPQRSGVKIADKIGVLARGKAWMMDECIIGAYDLVLAVVVERAEGRPPVMVRIAPEMTFDSSLDVSRLSLNEPKEYDD